MDRQTDTKNFCIVIIAVYGDIKFSNKGDDLIYRRNPMEVEALCYKEITVDNKASKHKMKVFLKSSEM